tara:strand:- start:27088 stop:27261 length:174 start_codon:yes stop_codon:yes gene_type:complete
MSPLEELVMEDISYKFDLRVMPCVTVRSTGKDDAMTLKIIDETMYLDLVQKNWKDKL